MQPTHVFRRTAIPMGLLVIGLMGTTMPGWSAEGGASAAVETAAAVERAMALELADRYDDLAKERVRGARELADLYRRMDSMVGTAQTAGSAALADLLREIQGAEHQRERVLEEQQEVVEGLAAALRRAELLEERISSLRELDREAAGPLTGQWEVVMLPNERRGVFSLTQSGTLVTGTYRLEGGWTGSLQGTLVNRKVYMVRIDSRLGRTMEFEGRLSEDGAVVRGSWLNYDLAADGGSEGQWTATRVDD